MALKTENLSFTYSNCISPVLNEITTTFHEKKLYLLLGPSGCGKSSFTNILAGIIPSNINGKLKGDILINNKSIIKKNSYERTLDIGYVMQDSDTQFCTYIVEDELLFGLENLKFSKEEMDNRLNKVLDILDISDLRQRTLNSLSGGQKQKVSIASILILDPPVIILDEPTANLDPVTSIEIFKIINNLKEKYNKTIIIIEHKLDYLMEYVDYIYLFDKNGYISDEGNPRHIFEYLANTKPSNSIHYPKILDLWKKLKLPYEDINFNIQKTGSYINRKYIYDSDKSEEKHYINNDKLLSISNIFYRKSNELIIDGLSFDVMKGDFLAVIGPNGAGKSTLAGIILNLYKEFIGQVNLDGKSIKSYKRKDLCKKAGLVFQNPEWQFVSYNVREELEYSLRNLNLQQEEAENKIDEYLERFNLLEFKEYNPYMLSQGQKRRLSVASMLITGQELLILDEPTYGQDYENQKELLDYLSELNSSGVTIIMITHDMDSVVNYCNKVLILKEGKSIYFGNNKDLFEDDRLLADANLVKPVYAEICEHMDCNFYKFPLNLNDFVSHLERRG